MRILDAIVRIIELIMGAIGIGIIAVILALLVGAAYSDLADPRPRNGTDECEAKQEAIFKRPVNRMQSPIELVKEVTHACK